MPVLHNVTATGKALSASSLSVAITVASNLNRAMLVAVFVNHTATPSAPTSVVRGGQTFTLVATQLTGVGTAVVYLYRLVNPNTGAGNVVVTLPGTYSSVALVASSYYNVDQTTPLTGITGNSQSGVNAGDGFFAGSAAGDANAGDLWYGAGAFLLGTDAAATVAEAPGKPHYATGGGTSSFTTGTGVTTITPPTPSKEMTGCLLIALVHQVTGTQSAHTCSTPGWTKIGQTTVGSGSTSVGQSLWWAKSSPTLADPVINGASGNYMGSVYRYGDVDLSLAAPAALLGTGVTSTTGNISHAGGSTTKANSTAAIFASALSGGAFGTPAGTGTWTAQGAATLPGRWGEWDEELGASGTASGTFTMTTGSGATAATMLQLFASTVAQTLRGKVEGCGSTLGKGCLSVADEPALASGNTVGWQQSAGADPVIWLGAYLTYKAPTVSLGPITARFDNAQTFYAPKISEKINLGARLDNAQAFYTPSITVSFAASLYANGQSFFAPKIAATIKQSARFDNAQTFYGPAIKIAPVKPSLHTNVQSFFGPKVAFKLTQTARLDNAQTFYTPTKLSVRFAIAARHNNAQGFFGPKVNVTVKPSLHTNAQGFFGPKLAATIKVAARFDNAQAFFAPSLKFTRTALPPLHTNAQQFFAPAILRRLKPTTRFDNAQGFFFPAAKISTLIKAARFDNDQSFFLPVAVNRAGAAIQAPPHVNVQQFFAPKIARTVKQTGGGAAAWDASGTWVLNHELSGGANYHDTTLVQDSAGNLTGSGGIAIYLYSITSGTVVGNAIEYFATYYTPALVVGVVLHVVGTIAPDGTISGTWTDTYGGGRAGTISTVSGAAVAIPGGAGFENQQTFYGPRVAPQVYVGAPLHQNAQAFYPPTLRLTVKPTRHDNAQQFYAPSFPLTVAPIRHTNAQAFYPSKIAFRVSQSVRFDNAQSFFGPRLKATVTTARLDNAQAFYAPSVARTVFPSRHDNAQQFFAPAVGRGALLPQRHDNAQIFYPPKIKVLVKASARFDNAQAFYAPYVSRSLKPTRHDNSQQFYPPKIKARISVTARFDNAQYFFGPKTSARYKVAARFDNVQDFYGTTVAVKEPNFALPTRYNNAQEFYGPTVVFTEAPQRDPAGALRMFTDARFVFNGSARLTEFTNQRRTVFRSRLIEGTFVT
jgi:hypothetical protein